MEEVEQNPHIIIVPAPAMGHLIPFIEFSKKLLFNHDFLVTFLIPTITSPSDAMVELFVSLPKSISYIFLPSVNLADLPSNTQTETRLIFLLIRSLPHIRDALKKIVLNSRVVALVADLFTTDAFDVAKEFNLSPYIFFPSNATALSFFLEFPELDKSCTCEYRDLLSPMKLPGCVPIHGSDLPSSVQDRKSEIYSSFLHHCKRYGLAEGIMVNSFFELEPGALKALTKVGSNRPPVYAVGPLIRSGGEKCDSDRSESLKWLDEQPHSSVLFISFGSNATLPHEQLIELAFGLEASMQRFLWVIRRTKDNVTNPPKTMMNTLDFLPKGFLDKTRGIGHVVIDWAPQVQVLSHGSTGGFLTHCGWNSSLESVVNGVPLIAWPLGAEQKLNAVVLDDMKVALRPKFGENGIVHRGEITKVVKRLMEGDEGKKLRSKMEDLMGVAMKALGDEGSSTKSFCEVASKLKYQN